MKEIPLRSFEFRTERISFALFFFCLFDRWSTAECFCGCFPKIFSFPLIDSPRSGFFIIARINDYHIFADLPLINSFLSSSSFPILLSGLSKSAKRERARKLSPLFEFWRVPRDDRGIVKTQLDSDLQSKFLIQIAAAAASSSMGSSGPAMARNLQFHRDPFDFHMNSFERGKKMLKDSI